MKKVSIIKGFFVILLSIMLIGANNVFAVDVDDEDEDDPETILMDDTGAESTPSQKTTIPTTENTPSNNTTSNNTVNNTSNNTANNTSSASVYNNTNNTPNSLSKAGLEDSLPTMVLIVVFGISAVYAYKKINDYKNI